MTSCVGVGVTGAACALTFKSNALFCAVHLERSRSAYWRYKAATQQAIEQWTAIRDIEPHTLTATPPQVLLHTYVQLKRAANLRRQFMRVHVHETFQDRGHVAFVADLDASTRNVEALLARVFACQQKQKDADKKESTIKTKIQLDEDDENNNDDTSSGASASASAAASTSAQRNQKRKKKKQLEGFLRRCTSEVNELNEMVEATFVEFDQLVQHYLDQTRHPAEVENYRTNPDRFDMFHQLAVQEGHGTLGKHNNQVSFTLDNMYAFQQQMVREALAGAFGSSKQATSATKSLVNQFVVIYNRRATKNMLTKTSGWARKIMFQHASNKSERMCAEAMLTRALKHGPDIVNASANEVNVFRQQQGCTAEEALSHAYGDMFDVIANFVSQQQILPPPTPTHL
jgi:hypothetical protein